MEETMNIYVYTDPEYRGSLWSAQTYRAICEEAAKKKYSVRLIECEDLDTFDFDTFFSAEKRKIVLCLTTSVGNTGKMIASFRRHGIHVLLVNHQSHRASVGCSNLIVDYEDGMHRIVSYLTSCGKTRPALYGINRNSATDMIKANYFNTYGSSAVFYNDAGLSQCFSGLIEVLENYDSFVCANDIVAYSLIRMLKQLGREVPRDFFVVSFGDSLLSQIGSPSLTTVAVDHEEIGRQAICAYSYLYRAGENIYMSAKVASTLRVRASTAMLQPSAGADFGPLVCQTPDPGVNFYNDEESRRILGIEQMLTKCDRIDLQIIIGLLRSVPYGRIASELFISENVVFYRIKRLIKSAGVDNKEQLILLLRDYLFPDAIAEFIENENKQHKGK